MSEQAEHDELRNQLSRYVEQPESSTTGHWYIIDLADLLREWTYIEFHFDDETGKLNMARLLREENE